ncbi:hypothetical protein JCM5353_008568 [Sporobolomyces roseus]
MSGGLHRRTSSAALHYSSLLSANGDPNHHQGQDISLYTSSSASASSSTRSQSSKPHSSIPISHHRPESLQEDEMEEKEGLLGQGGPSPRIHPSITVIPNGRNKKRRSKCRILFLFMVLSSAGILLYALVTGWIAKRDVEKVWGNWKDWQKENWGSDSTLSTNSTAESLNSTDASSIQALLASKGRPASVKSNVSSIVSASLPSSTSLRSSSKLFNDDDNTVSKSNMTYGSFSYAQIKEANEMVDQGNFSVYKWHETLPSLKTSTSYASKKKEAGRLIVVGDLHGSHHSLFHLLRRISYTPSHDTLLHTGDITSKSTLHNSLATLTLLRKLGAKGVRGNHDQKVLEWRKWMQHLGPLNQTEIEIEEVLGVHSTIGREQKRLEGIERAARIGASGTASKAYEESLRRDREEEEEYRMRKMRSMKPRDKKLRKRDWRSWLGTSDEDTSSSEDVSQEEVLETGEGDGGEPTYEAYEEEEDGQESIITSVESESSTSVRAKATDRRRPFGQRPSRLASPSSSSISSPIARPTSLSSSSSKSVPLNTTLLGPLWAHLDPSLSGSERNRLGLKTPTGWEWGDEHFEIARSMSDKDVAYLEGLPLTLWVEELNSFIVHAGLVPWTETPTSTFSPLPSSLSTSPLVSTSSMTFTPPSSNLYQSLSSSLQGSLYLTPQNTDPFTLLSMRTLSLVHPSSHSDARVKGPPSEWRVSSKSKKAGRNSRPWWSVWEDSMDSYEDIEEGEEGGQESVGVIYGHWAAQGLEVQKHSIGLDSGCVYGRQLSALVLDLSDNLSPASPLSNNTTADSSSLSSSSSSPSSSKGYTAPLDSTRYKSSVEKTLKSETGERLSKSRPNWGNDKAGSMERISKGSSSSLTPPADSSSISSSDSSDSTRDQDDSTLPEDLVEEGEKPWWKPWKRSSSSEEEAEGDEEEEFIQLDEETKKLIKRAPPQFRPMGGLDEEKILAAAAGARTEEDEDESEEGVNQEEEESSSESEPTTTSTRRTRPKPTRRVSHSSSSSLTPSSTSTPHRQLKLSSSFPPAASPTSLKLNQLSTTSDVDEDDEDELPVLKSETEAEEGPDYKGDSEDLFSAKQVEYKPLKRGKKVWIVQVDCGVEVGMGEE